jgi:hypothetical protein
LAAREAEGVDEAVLRAGADVRDFVRSVGVKRALPRNRDGGASRPGPDTAAV